MRKIILGIFTTLFLCFLILGWWGFSFHNEKTFRVGSSPEVIYNYLLDPGYYPQWYDGFVRHDYLGGGFQEEGVQYLLHIQEEGETYEVIETYIQLDSPELIQKEHQHDFYNLDISIQLTRSMNDSTTVTIREKIYGTRFIERVLLPLYASQVMKEHLDSYQSALQIVEQE